MSETSIPETDREKTGSPDADGAEEPRKSSRKKAKGDRADTTALESRIAELEAELSAARDESGKNLEGWQRSRAEFVNYKKRTERELAEKGEQARLDMLLRLLPIIDDFERALSNIPQELQDNPWLDGIMLIQRKFEKLLEEHAVTILDPVGEPFNPSVHEAVGMEESDEVESGHVTTTLQKGYISGERLLRPALVRVAG